MSLARRHFERTCAQLAASAAAPSAGPVAPPMPETGAAAGEYQQLLIALGEDRRQLQEIQSIERKIEAKRAMIGRYTAWVEGALDAETAAQDEIVARMLLWSMDVGDWPLALRIAAHVLEHGLALPETFKRKPATAIAEEAAEAGLKKPPLVGRETLQAIAAITADQDMHDQVRAKLEKAIGLSFAAAADAYDPEAESAQAGGKAPLVSAALEHFRRALGLDSNSGVKKQIERLEAELRKLAPPETTVGAQS